MKKASLLNLLLSLSLLILVACENGGVSIGISSQKSLETISISKGNLTPAFSADVSEYTAAVDYTDTTFDLSLAPSSSKAKCYVNGQEVTSGSVSIPLNVGENTVTVTVKAEDGMVNTYTIKITRVAAASNPELQTLTLSSGVLNPAYAAGTLNYTASVLYGVSSVDVTVVPVEATSTITINGESATSGVAKAVALAVGSNSVPVVVTAQDDSVKTYIVDITRSMASANADLASLALSVGTLSPGFSLSTLSYTASGAYSQSSLNVTATTSSEYATLTIGGQTAISGVAKSIALSVGANSIPIVITAQNGTTKTYTLSFTRNSANATTTLSDLILSSGRLSPGFDPGTNSYSVSISTVPTSYTVTATALSGLSSLQYKVNGGSFSNLMSGVASGFINPTVGANTLEVVVTAESGATKTYTLNITYDICGAGYYSDAVNSCAQVGLGYYSPAANNSRYACTNKPANSRYTSPTASSSSCPWSCENGYITTDGASCSASANATTLACADNEIAVGLYGRFGAIIDKLGVRCATIDAAGNLGTPRNGPVYGGEGGSEFNFDGVDDCPAGSALYKVSGDLTNFSGTNRTGRVSFSCKSIANPAGDTKVSPTYGANFGRGAFAFICGVSPNLYGAFLNGIIIDIASGAAYTGDILGITCR